MSSREIVRYAPGSDLVADYPTGADVIVSQEDRSALSRPRELTTTSHEDRAACRACETALREIWGDEYEQRIAINAKVLEIEFGLVLADDLLYARLPDGRRVADVPQFSAGLSELICLAMTAVNQGATPPRSASLNSSPGDLESQRKQIQEIMQTDFGRYQREGLAAKYEQLLAEMGAHGMLDQWRSDNG